MINLEQAFRLDVDLAPPLDVQEAPQGYRRVIPITGGTFSGDRIDGVILPGGADWNLVRHDGIVHLWARYTLKTNDGVLISILTKDFSAARKIRWPAFWRARRWTRPIGIAARWPGSRSLVKGTGG